MIIMDRELSSYPVLIILLKLLTYYIYSEFEGIGTHFMMELI